MATFPRGQYIDSLATDAPAPAFWPRSFIEEALCFHATALQKVVVTIVGKEGEPFDPTWIPAAEPVCRWTGFPFRKADAR